MQRFASVDAGKGARRATGYQQRNAAGPCKRRSMPGSAQASRASTRGPGVRRGARRRTRLARRSAGPRADPLKRAAITRAPSDPDARLGRAERAGRLLQRCRLCERRTQTVFGVGDRERTGCSSARRRAKRKTGGRALCRAGGPLLDRCCGRRRPGAIRRFYRERDQVPPAGQPQSGAGRNGAFEPFLQRQVALVKPKLILALGRFAAQSLLKTDASIASLRGRVHRVRGRAGDRHVSPRVPAAQPARQGEGVGRPVSRARHVARGGRRAVQRGKVTDVAGRRRASPLRPAHPPRSSRRCSTHCVNRPCAISRGCY